MSKDDAISRDAVLSLWSLRLSDKEIYMAIHDMPPVTQKSGKWIRIDKDKCKCDQCEIISYIAMYPNGDANYCPNCGAKMESEDKE